jgi:hypothetical protein
VVFGGQIAGKPGFVVDDHLSSLAVARKIKRVSTNGRIALMLISLQLAGFTFSACHHATLWALTPLISPLPLFTEVVLFLWHFP